MADILPAAAEAAGATPAAAPAAEAAVVAEAGAAAPTAVAISASQGNVYYLGMGPSQLNAVLDPAGAQTTLKWKSSKKKVVKVDANGVITPRKAGKAKITVTTGNKKKSSIKVTVLKNKVDGINARPSRSLIRSIGRSWTIAPKSVERTAGGKYVCKFYLLNGLGKSKRINNMGLQLYVGGTLVAQKHINRLRVSCGKGSTKVFKVTFGGSDIVDPTPMLLPQYGTSGVLFKLTTAPSLTYAIRR
ncbi:MAG: Ig-like domain-containing protein [Clostridia bacterium]|nr:Ig-like domain-containing protein [Clostridia bacterium]